MGLERTGNGYLVDPTIWTEEIMHEMAKEDDMELTESMVGQIMSAREYFEENSSYRPFELLQNTLALIKKYYSKNG